jgi:uncharacterized membrane protein
MEAPAHVPATHTAVKEENPGLVLGIIGMIMAFTGLQLVGLILSILSMNKSKSAGYSDSLGKVGMILNIVFLVLVTIFIVFYILIIIAAAASGSYNSDF